MAWRFKTGVRSLTITVLCGLIAVAPGAFAQDIPPADMPPAGAPDEQAAPTAVLWCSVADGANQRLLVSSVTTLTNPSYITINTYSGRFGRTVNARYGLHLGLEGNYCHRAGTVTAASAARAALVARMAAQNMRIVSVGIF